MPSPLSTVLGQILQQEAATRESRQASRERRQAFDAQRGDQGIAHLMDAIRLRMDRDRLDQEKQAQDIGLQSQLAELQGKPPPRYEEAWAQRAAERGVTQQVYEGLKTKREAEVAARMKQADAARAFTAYGQKSDIDLQKHLSELEYEYGQKRQLERVKATTGAGGAPPPISRLIPELDIYPSQLNAAKAKGQFGPMLDNPAIQTEIDIELSKATGLALQKHARGDIPGARLALQEFWLGIPAKLANLKIRLSDKDRQILLNMAQQAQQMAQIPGAVGLPPVESEEEEDELPAFQYPGVSDPNG